MTRLNGTSTAVTLVVAGLLGACAGSGSDSDIDQVRPPPPSDVAATIEPTGTEPPVPATGQLGGAAPTAAAIEGLLAAGRVDLSPTGNRVIEGPGSLLADEPLIIDARVADTTAVWIAPTGPSDWLVVSSDGSVDIISTVGDEVTVEPLPTAPLDPSLGPPLVTTSAGATLVEVHDVLRSFFADPLPDTRVTTDGSRLVAVGGPTDRYPHGVLGDVLEGSTIDVVDLDGGSRTPVSIDGPDVFEAISPMLADVDGDGAADAVMTVSNGETGSRLVAYDLADGSIVGESEPIGQSNRWRNLLAIAPTGPDGETEIIDILTPHIGGTLQFFQLVDGRLEQVASAGTYSTHSIGSRNLDLGIVTDADGDGRLDVLLPTQDMSELAVVTRDATADTGTREVARVALGGRLTSNVAAAVTDGGVAYAVGVSDGSVRLWLP